MRRGVLILAAIATAATTACGGGDVTVLAELEGAATGADEGTEAVALRTLPVRLLPYDRDAIFDSLARAFPEAEPQLPDSLFQLQQRVAERQREWQQAENRWAAVRDSLKTMSEQMETMDKSSGEYFALYRDFNDLLDQVDALEARSKQLFNDFISLQTRLNAQSQEIKLARRTWADEAYAPIDSIIEARLEVMGLEELADTTSAEGVARFRGVAPGRWWVHGRYDRQFDELYWNEPIEVERGAELSVRLTQENAEVRQKM